MVTGARSEEEYIYVRHHHHHHHDHLHSGGWGVVIFGFTKWGSLLAEFHGKVREIFDVEVAIAEEGMETWFDGGVEGGGIDNGDE